MSRPESINDVAVDALRILAEVKAAAAPYCDFGEVLGAVEESKAIEDEMRVALDAFARRALVLQRRIRKWERGEREVTMLKRPSGDQKSGVS